MTVRRRRWLGAFFFALMFGHFGVYAYSALTRLRGSYDGWDARLSDGGAQIASVDQNGPATALRVGDEFVSINGLTLRDDPEILNYSHRVPPDAVYTMVIRRQGQAIELALATTGAPIKLRLQIIVDRLEQLLFLLTGLTIFLLKPADRHAWLLALTLGLFPGLFNNDLPPLPLAILLTVAVARTLGLWWAPVFCHFLLIFPDRSSLLRRFPILERGLYWPFILILPRLAFMRLGMIFHAREQWAQFFERSWMLQQPWIGLLSNLVMVSYLTGGLAALFASYREAGVSARRKLHVIVAGSGAGVFNLLLLILWERFLQTRLPEARDWIGFGLTFTLPLIPLSFAYAIIRHQVIPVSLIIRRSARYVLVSRGAILLDMIAAALSVAAVLTFVFNRIKPPVIVIGLVSAAVGVLTWKIASGLRDKYLRPLIDRRFFRQSYDAHQIIAELTRSLRGVTDLPRLLELVATKIRTALQTEYVTIYLRDSATGSFNTAYSSDSKGANNSAGAGLDGGQLSRYAMLVDHLDQLEKSLGETEPRRHDRPPEDEIELDAILSDYDGAATPGEKREELLEANATLLMPLFSNDGMLGVISLGPRLGDLPFSREDKRLLRSVSGPTALAIENARLVEQMVAEARRRQEIEIDHRRKTEELAFARQLQLSMLPAGNVSLDNLEIIGRMRAATEVGGDYYDFIETGDGRICVAVGDATGHGMAAGLVVGMVKMGLINSLQRMNGQVGVKPLIEDLNRALKRALSQRGMGMCLGAAILDASSLKVEVLSNGMPAPYHYSATAHSLSPIETKAPPLGFLRQINVRPIEMRLGPGDALIWLSDGFEERMNHDDQIWGSENVERTLALICMEEASAENIARRMIDACDAAAEGRNNDDDMTIVVAKIRRQD
ncbi:MAG: SpoIIE family protein phosphatase [Chloracidobacterium sp.]|nr:SpoIIE family protein phosphatase [Chloracidobacterium sp.]